MKWKPAYIQGHEVLVSTTKSKYRNVKVKYQDEKPFDSIKEFKYWLKIKIIEKANAGISNVRRQVTYELFPRTVLKDGCILSKTVYIADFVYYDHLKEEELIIDVKGTKTATFKRKAKWFFQRYKKHIICV